VKNLTLAIFDKFAVKGMPRFSDGGCFVMPSPTDGLPLRIIAATGLGWDHVSVSRVERCPDWYELEHVKRTFFWPHETAMQLHVPPAEHINNHPHCLHLWRPTNVEIPRPPGAMVGGRDMTQEQVKALGLGLFQK
jgi:hypothetical protein